VKTLRTLATVAMLVTFWARAAVGVEPFRITLRFVSDKDVKPTPARMATPFAVGQVTDERGLDDPTVLGESQTKLHSARPVVSVTPVPEFIEQALRGSFAEWNVNVAADADLVLRCEILQLGVLEQNRVVADARFRFLLEDRNGSAVWQAEVAGNDGEWGMRSLNERIYLEALSKATKEAFADLFDKTDFRTALKKFKPTPRPTP
jgi:hypothetical protein